MCAVAPPPRRFIVAWASASTRVFQAACLVVLAAYGVGAGPALAYGIILQAVEVLTALALGTPALLREGLTWSDIRSAEAAGGTATTEVLPP